MPSNAPSQETWPTDQRRSRPWLLPYNRRLRHLNAISIRNISAEDPLTNKGPAALDDEVLPQTRASPAKLIAKEERKLVGHSHSSSDLKSLADSAAAKEQDGLPSGDTDTDKDRTQAISTPTKPAKRPSKRLRRRSTLDWMTASPAARQKRFEALASSQLMDTFFSLHVEDDEVEPIYVSEVVEKSMNPSFESFSLQDSADNISRLDSVIAKIWTRSASSTSFEYFLKLQVHMESLLFVGKQLTDFRRTLPSNSVLFHFTDGIYMMPSDGIALPPPPAIQPPRTSSTLVLPTSSYDALMRLSTLDVCVQDALATRSRLEAEITQLLKFNKQPLETIRCVSINELQATQIEQILALERRRLEAAKRRRVALRKSIQERHSIMAIDRTHQSTKLSEMKAQQPHLAAVQEALTQTHHDITTQRQRICSSLETIFPITPFPAKPLLFTIRGLYLPNSNFDDIDDQSVSAALGFVAQIVTLLSFYLSTPLPYEPNPQGSSSTISDAISATTASTTYPLFLKGTPRFRFEYGVFLLNKDIEILSNRLGLRVLDPRQMLPNLKYLLYIATAGKEEISSRRVGGLRAFLRAGSIAGSRRGSVGSMSSQNYTPGNNQGQSRGEHRNDEEGVKVSVAIRTKAKANGAVVTMGVGIDGQQSPIKASKLRQVS